MQFLLNKRVTLTNVYAVRRKKKSTKTEKKKKEPEKDDIEYNAFRLTGLSYRKPEYHAEKKDSLMGSTWDILLFRKELLVLGEGM